MQDIIEFESHEKDRYYFDDLTHRMAHDVTREKYLIQAQAINEVIRPYIVNSSKKVRYTKGLGEDTYNLPHLHVRLTSNNDGNEGLPVYVMEAEIINPKTGVAFVVDMNLDYVDKVTSLDFAVFAEHINSALIQFEADKGRISKEGIIV